MIKTQADEELTTADEAGYVVLRQPPASELANLFRIDAWNHALGLVARQVGGRVTEHPPVGWLGPRTRSLSMSGSCGWSLPIRYEVRARASLRPQGGARCVLVSTRKLIRSI